LINSLLETKLVNPGSNVIHTGEYGVKTIENNALKLVHQKKKINKMPKKSKISKKSPCIAH